MILITGATGQFGSKAVDHVLKMGIDPNEISVLVRDVAKADHLKGQGVHIKEGNYEDNSSMVKAFNGVDKLLLVSSNDRAAVEYRTNHHKNAIQAAKEAGVKHIVYTSFVRKPGFEDTSIADFQNSHLASEQYLKQSGVDYTILQNSIYAEMIPAFIGGDFMETGTILFPAGEGKASWVLREELAEAAAHVLLTTGHENRTYTLTNNNSVGFKDIATALSEVLGKEINYTPIDMNEYKTALSKAGVPELYIGMLVMWGAALAQHTMDKEDNTLSKFLGRAPTAISQFLKKIYS
ncbi:SDR family oxidoreductase [Chryseobacterium populi]|uniref:Putative nucleoside-diphosphate sugar epimerase n=1 Tax=Chryseobacterium populi TaxID=1144316 RepID=J3CM07_9FLAO|nr:SDR family oxidoreductase [Chryseobacterium populi]EJL74349.1 putative nucleoside-diphosphate sugar epimerase [Chryseobacterium populi]